MFSIAPLMFVSSTICRRVLKFPVANKLSRLVDAFTVVSLTLISAVTNEVFEGEDALGLVLAVTFGALENVGIGLNGGNETGIGVADFEMLAVADTEGIDEGVGVFVGFTLAG